MGKKRHGHEASSSWVKKDENSRDEGPLISRVARVLLQNWQLCDGWNDVHLPGGWRLSTARVPVLTIQHSGPERLEEIERGSAILSPDIRCNTDFTVGYPMWNTYHRRHVVLDKQRKAGFLGDKDYSFGPPPRHRRPLLRTLPPPSPTSGE
jgi:hypothetical protein